MPLTIDEKIAAANKAIQINSDAEKYYLDRANAADTAGAYSRYMESRWRCKDEREQWESHLQSLISEKFLTSEPT